MFSQIGYFAIPPEVVRKTLTGEPLSEEEQIVITRSPQVAYELISKIPRLENVAKIILYQNKRFDGTGFPADSVAQEEIPVGSRILKVLLDLDQTVSRGIAAKDVLRKFRERQGWYDPAILEVASRLPSEQNGVEDGAAMIQSAVELSNLRNGDILVDDVKTAEGLLLISKGNEVSDMLLARLRNYANITKLNEPFHIKRAAVGATE